MISTPAGTCMMSPASQITSQIYSSACGQAAPLSAVHFPACWMRQLALSKVIHEDCANQHSSILCIAVSVAKYLVHTLLEQGCINAKVPEHSEAACHAVVHLMLHHALLHAPGNFRKLPLHHAIHPVPVQMCQISFPHEACAYVKCLMAESAE